MGKNKVKNQDGAPNPASITNRDILQRLNFLYQASVLLNGLTPSAHRDDDGNLSKPSTIPNDKDIDRVSEMGGPSSRPSKSRKKRRRRMVSFEELSRSYVETMKSVGQKTNVRMDPSVKRRICKRCSAPLVPGISTTVRIQDSASHGHLISYRCHCCQMQRRIPAPPVLHVDMPLEGDTHMDILSAGATTSPAPIASTSTGSLVPRVRRKKGPQPRLPPYFARDAGHVVFRGNERLNAA